MSPVEIELRVAYKSGVLLGISLWGEHLADFKLSSSAIATVVVEDTFQCIITIDSLTAASMLHPLPNTDPRYTCLDKERSETKVSWDSLTAVVP